MSKKSKARVKRLRHGLLPASCPAEEPLVAAQLALGDLVHVAAPPSEITAAERRVDEEKVRFAEWLGSQDRGSSRLSSLPSPSVLRARLRR